MEEKNLSRGSVTQLRAENQKPASHPEIRSGAMLATGAPLGAVRLATDLIMYVWWPAQTPLSFDVETLLARLQAMAPGHAWTSWQVRRYRAWATTFFREVGKDQWLPVGDYYCLPKAEPARQVSTAMRA
jgi:hypothetical protein